MTRAETSPAPLLRVDAEPGRLAPPQVRALAVAHGLAARYLQPLPVPEAKEGAPGVWHRDGGVWVTPLLLHPDTCAGVEARAFLLPGVSLGGGGAVVAAAPLEVEGVVAVFPDLFGGEEVVVARKGAAPWEAVPAAFEKAGCKARAKP